MKFKEYLEENISMEMSANWDDVKDSLKKAGIKAKKVDSDNIELMFSKQQRSKVIKWLKSLKTGVGVDKEVYPELFESEQLDEMSFAKVYGRVGNKAKALMKETCDKMGCDEAKACMTLSEMYKNMAEQGIK
jgi:hypothetical protein